MQPGEIRSHNHYLVLACVIDGHINNHDKTIGILNADNAVDIWPAKGDWQAEISYVVTPLRAEVSEKSGAFFSHRPLSKNWGNAKG